MRALRFIAGGIAGFLVWWYATLVYDGALSFVAERLLRFDERLCAAHVVAAGRIVEVTPHLCVAPTATIPADQLTYNLILLAALFAMRFRSVQAFLASLFALFVSHVLSLAVSIESTYAGRLGEWSNRHYGGFEQDFWTAAEFWWRLVGMFAFVFIVWWLTLGPMSRYHPQPRKKK